MQSLQRMEDKLKAVTKENIEMVSIEEQNEHYCITYVFWCVCLHSTCMYKVCLCNAIDKIYQYLGLYIIDLHNIVGYAYMCNIFKWIHKISL